MGRNDDSAHPSRSRHQSSKELRGGNLSFLMFAYHLSLAHMSSCPPVPAITILRNCPMASPTQLRSPERRLFPPLGSRLRKGGRTMHLTRDTLRLIWLSQVSGSSSQYRCHHAHAHFAVSIASFFALSLSRNSFISSLDMLYEPDTWLNGLSGCLSNSLRI